MWLESDATKNIQNKIKINSSHYLHLAEYKNNSLSVDTPTRKTSPWHLTQLTEDLGITKPPLKTFPFSHF